MAGDEARELTGEIGLEIRAGVEPRLVTSTKEPCLDRPCAASAKLDVEL